jgi:hypothetical protein
MHDNSHVDENCFKIWPQSMSLMRIKSVDHPNLCIGVGIWPILEKTAIEVVMSEWGSLWINLFSNGRGTKGIFPLAWIRVSRWRE